MRKTVTIYTDGACRGNPGPGGWGAVLQYGEREKQLFGGERETTNNRMELTAAIRALEALTKHAQVILYTDSVYVQRGITQWVVNWQKQGWRNAAKKPVKNADLWQQLLVVAAPHEIEWRWVKGHSGDLGNTLADSLANKGIDELL